jgi:GNAT superfamily N-acetyltransferase
MNDRDSAMNERCPVVIRSGQLPGDAELLALYDAAGWTAYTANPARLAAALRGSALVVTARGTDGALVGLARAISDNATVCYLQDILVHPDQQRRGIGRSLMTAVLTHYADLRQFVLLTENDPVQRYFYAGLGLTRSDTRGLHAYLR